MSRVESNRAFDKSPLLCALFFSSVKYGDICQKAWVSFSSGTWDSKTAVGSLSKVLFSIPIKFLLSSQETTVAPWGPWTLLHPGSLRAQLQNKASPWCHHYFQNPSKTSHPNRHELLSSAKMLELTDTKLCGPWRTSDRQEKEMLNIPHDNKKGPPLRGLSHRLCDPAKDTGHRFQLLPPWSNQIRKFSKRLFQNKC